MSNFFARSILERGVARDLGVTSPDQIRQLAGDFLSQQAEIEMLQRELSLKAMRTNIAMHALGGLCATLTEADGQLSLDELTKRMSETAIAAADALITELQK